MYRIIQALGATDSLRVTLRFNAPVNIPSIDVFDPDYGDLITKGCEETTHPTLRCTILVASTTDVHNWVYPMVRKSTRANRKPPPEIVQITADDALVCSTDLCPDIEVNTQYWRNVLEDGQHITTTNSLEECRQVCIDWLACVGFTFVKAQTNDENCFQINNTTNREPG